MRPATSAWPYDEADPQRQAVLAAADRLLTGTPRHSTGRLSIVQTAAEAQLKYWVVAQKHTGLRDHFQRLAAHAGNTSAGLDAPLSEHDKLMAEHAALKRHCAGLEQVVTLYATAINELTLENQALREQQTTVTLFRRRFPDRS